MKSFYRYVTAMLVAILVIGLPATAVQASWIRNLLRRDRQEAAVEGEVRTFTALGLGAQLWSSTNHMNDPIGEAISEATGVRLVGETPMGRWQDALALMLASNDLPDLVFNTGNSRDLMYNAGVLRPLKDLMLASPNIVDFYGDEIMRNAYIPCPNLDFYSLGVGRKDSEYVPDTHWEFAYYVQFPVLEAAGYPDLKTPQDFERVIANYIAANPTTPEGRPMYGMSFWIGDNWRHSLLNGITNTAGLPSDTIWYFDMDNVEVTSIFRHPAAKQYMDWLNHLNDVGLLDPELVTQSQEMLIEKISNGQVAGIMHAKWLTWQAAEYIQDHNSAHDTLGFPLRWDPDNTIWRDQQGRGTREGFGASITTAVSEEDTKLLVNFFDYLMSDEGQQLMGWGIEGVHYTFDPDCTALDWRTNEPLYIGNDPRGIRRLSPDAFNLRFNPDSNRVDIRHRTGLEKYGNQMLGSRFVAQSGLILNDFTRDPDEYFATRSPEAQKVLAAYGLNSEKGNFPPGMPRTIGLPNILYGPSHDIPVGVATERHQVAQAQYLESVPVELAKLIVVPRAQFNAEWDNYIRFLETQVNISMLEEEMTKGLRDRLTLWYGGY
jgi:putative aldouronate transport system substrate-binding protein